MRNIHNNNLLEFAAQIRNSGPSNEVLNKELFRAQFMLPAHHEHAFLSAKAPTKKSLNIDAVVADLNDTLKIIFANEAVKQLLESDVKTPSLTVTDNLPKNFGHFASFSDPNNNIYTLSVPKGMKEHVMVIGLFFIADKMFKEATRSFGHRASSSPALASYSFSSPESAQQPSNIALFKQPEMLAFIKRHLRTFDFSILEPTDRQPQHKLKISASDSTGHCYTETFPAGSAASLKRTFQTLQELGILAPHSITHHKNTLCFALPHRSPKGVGKIIDFNFQIPDEISKACDFAKRILANTPVKIKQDDKLEALQTPQFQRSEVPERFLKAYALRKKK